MVIEPLVPPPKKGGRPRNTDMREVMNAVVYVTKSGCDWRMLPHDFPQWDTVYHYFRHWKEDGTWKDIHDTLRTQLRKKLGKSKQPTAAVIDSQSAKTAEKGGFVGMMLARR